MGLLQQPGPAFQFEVDNLTGTPPAPGSLGTNFTFGASNADGTAVSVLSALAVECQYLVLGITGTGTSAEDNSALLDVLIDRAGGTSWSSFIDDLVCGFPHPASAISHAPAWYHFPIRIPAGASIGVQARKNGATAITTGRVVMWAYGRPKRPDMWWCGQGVESLGINASTSKGTSHTPGSSGAFSSYATIGTSTRRYGALQLGINGSDSAMLARGYFWQLGVGSARLEGTPTIAYVGQTSEQCRRSGQTSPLWVDIAESTALQVRATCSGAAEAYDVAIYGVY
jgi:hypothetical protein